MRRAVNKPVTEPEFRSSTPESKLNAFKRFLNSVLHKDAEHCPERSEGSEIMEMKCQKYS